MKAIILFIFFTILTVPTVFGQIKIGDNPQNIDPTSVLELESTSKVLVITRVSTLEMEAINPQRGGMVYNTDTECINYYDGTQWINLCDAVNFTITNDPIINGRSTIEITESAGGYNLEVAKNSILGDNIIDGGIGPDDIQDNSITQDKLAAESVGSSELRQNSVGTEEIRDGSIAPADIANFIPGQVLTTDENGIVQWQDSDELYDLTFNKLDNTLTISRSTTPGVSTIDLAALVGSDDQQLNLTGNILSIENDPNTYDLSTYLQQISINTAGNEISLTNGGTITLPNPTIDTDEQNLGTTTLANEILTITIENGDPTTADLTPFATDAVVTAGLALKENIANKSNDVTLGNSTDLYPTQNAVKTYVDNTVGGSAQTIVSADPNNSILPSVNDGGAFYNDGDGNSQNELQNINFDTNTNILTISTPLTTGNEVDLSSLADATVVDGTETVLKGGIKIGISGNGSSADPYVINASEDIALDNGKILIGNPTGEASEAFINGDAKMNNQGLLTIEDAAITPLKIEPAPGVLTEDQVLITTITGDVEWADFPPGGGGDDDQNASEVDYDNTTSGLAAITTQAAIDELAGSGLVDTDEQNIAGSILTGDVLTIGIEGGNNQDVSLATFALDTEVATAIAASDTADGDKSDTNEIQNITSTNGSVTVTPSATGNDFDLAVPGSSDNQNIDGSILTGDVLTIGIEGGNNQDVSLATFALDTEVATAIAASDTADGDKSDTNEIQILTIAGNVLSLSNGGGTATIVGNNNITSTSLTVGGATNALLGNVTIEIPPNSITQGELANNSVGAGELRSDAVSSDEIDDESIVNIDIAPGAAIDGSKINPVFIADVSTTGNLQVGGNVTVTGTHTPVPDYVFQKYFLGNSILNSNYEFKTLAEIEAFVKENNHLPGIQSAQAVKEQGFWNVSESSRVNLEKIEELFLHTIEQEKKIKELKAANTNMQTEMDALKAQMEEIKSMLLEKENN